MKAVNRSRAGGGLAWLRLFALLLGIVISVPQPGRGAGPVSRASLKAAMEAANAEQTPVLAVFGAPWCAPCKLLKRTLAAAEFIEHAGALQLAEIDVDAETGIANDYGVEAIPTLVLLTGDGKIVLRHTGNLESAELLDWLREGRERIKAGQWEGMVPGAKLTPFIARAAADQLDTNDLVRLVELLGEPNPADREAAAKLLLEQREQAVTPLIHALTNECLAVRIGASETLLKLTSDTAPPDPWQSPAELARSVADLQKWWSATGKLPPARPAPLIDSSTADSIAGALDSLRGNDPVRRTAAMSTLVGLGPAALPAIREAIRAAEKTGDQRSVGLLEDVRWTILIPDSLEQSINGIRRILAGGKNPERKAAATRLGNAGRAAIPALAELANDPDVLVVEAAVRALSNIAGKDTVPAMAALLKATDPNLRMTAAQALGHTKSPAATKELLTVLEDPNEVVVCAALSALDEIQGERDYSPSKPPQSPEVVKGLKPCLADPRWRVRAAAAELTGKLGVSELSDDVSALLGDADGFVIKNALEALQKLGSTPEPAKVLDLARHHADLRGQAVELLVGWRTEEAAKAITELYNSSAVEGRTAILQSLAAGSGNNQNTNAAKLVLNQAIGEADPRLRRAAAQSLAAQPPGVAAPLVGRLLADEDQETRVAAAGVVLSIVGRERQVVAGPHGTRIAEFMSADEMDNSGGSSRKKATNAPPATPEQVAAWHAALQKQPSARYDLLMPSALYVTGETNTGLPGLRAAIEQADAGAFEKLSHSAALAALVPRLPWPDSKSVVERLSLYPGSFLKMIGHLQVAAPGMRDFLLEPERFRAAVEPTAPDNLESSLQHLLTGERTGWSFFSADAHTLPIINALLGATNAAWRAAAVYSLGFQEQPTLQAAIEHALSDTNAWVRAAAAASLTRVAKDRALAERLLGPLVSDDNKRVVQIAMTGLLEPETRVAAELQYRLGYFEYEKAHAWAGAYEENASQRPLATVQGNPPFLEQARQKVAGGSADDAALSALLLAQYGDFTGLDRLLQAGTVETQPESENVVLTCIGLTRDAKYVPDLKKILGSAKQDEDFRRLLQALRGMTGTEARELRLEINKHMRQARE